MEENRENQIEFTLPEADPDLSQLDDLKESLKNEYFYTNPVDPAKGISSVNRMAQTANNELSDKSFAPGAEGLLELKEKLEQIEEIRNSIVDGIYAFTQGNPKEYLALISDKINAIYDYNNQLIADANRANDELANSDDTGARVEKIREKNFN